MSVSGVFSWWVGCEPRLAHPSRSGRWPEMRLGFAAFGSHCGGLVQNASQSRGFSRIQANSRRLRRILDQVPGKTPFPPGTQTHFGPVDAKQGCHVAQVRFATGLRARTHRCENSPFPPLTSASPQGRRPAPPETAAEFAPQSEGLQDEPVVREMGLEPTRLGHWNLNPARLPIPPLARPPSVSDPPALLTRRAPPATRADPPEPTTGKADHAQPRPAASASTPTPARARTHASASKGKGRPSPHWALSWAQGRPSPRPSRG